MKWISVIGLMLVAACSQTPKNDTKLEVVRISPNAIEVCQNYQKNILDQAYTQSKDGSVHFTRDQGLARSALSRFDVEKGLIKQKTAMIQNILKQCDAEKIKTFNDELKRVAGCSLMFSELNFFQGLASALKKYPWPMDLTLEGKKVALDYVRFFSQGHYPLLNRLVALSVLDELSINQIVNKDLHQEIKVLMQESQAYVEGLKMKLIKDSGLTCESLHVMRDELAYSELMGQKMQELLTRI